ncbi:3'-5' exonuclease [Microbotryomycetes sp. JL201]|nr:3'-5' exonuclease [Microbotryomycetes sp. JL201]
MAAASSNWKSLKQVIKPSGSATTKSINSSDARPLKRKRLSIADDGSQTSSTRSVVNSSPTKDAESTERFKERPKVADKKMVPVEEIMSDGQQEWQKDIGQYLAMDCEMVGVGPDAEESTLARVSIVNYHGHCVLDRFVKPREKVTDYRTWVSGVREEDLVHAPTFAEVQREVAALIKDRILIGHALSNDTQVLLLSHPWTMIRDTAKYGPLQALARTKRPGLKSLAKLCLGIDIQSGEHSSITDARATMAVYRTQKSAWESSLHTHSKPKLVTTSTPALQSIDLTALHNTSKFVSKREQLGSSLRGIGRGGGTGSKSFGLAKAIRLAKAEQEADDAQNQVLDEPSTAIDNEKRKKRRNEDEDGLVVGISFDEPARRSIVDNSTATAAAGGSVSTTSNKKRTKKTKTSAKGSETGSRVVSTEVKRPKSKDSWWEDE